MASIKNVMLSPGWLERFTRPLYIEARRIERTDEHTHRIAADEQLISTVRESSSAVLRGASYCKAGA